MGHRERSRTDPDWFRNLRAVGEAEVEIGTHGVRVLPEVLGGAERDRVWPDVILAQVPGQSTLSGRASRRE